MLVKGSAIKEKRSLVGLSQSKLSSLTGINQARISAFELGKLELDFYELKKISSSLKKLNSTSIKIIKKKRYQNSDHLLSLISLRPRKAYSLTDRNKEYLTKLANLEANFNNLGKKKFKAISFFAGCGGLCYGVKAAGFEIVATNELEEDYKRIYKLNFSDANFLSNDIREITNKEIKSLMQKHNHIDLMIGGPPCQGFSLAGKRDVNDNRNNLFSYYLKLAEQIKPKIILIENVRLLTSMKDAKGNYIRDQILMSFELMGYTGGFFNINAKDYGVPQHRERVIFIAAKKSLKKRSLIGEGEYGNLDNLFAQQKPHFTFGDATSDLDFLESGEKSQTDKQHWAVNHPEHVIRWLIDVPEGKSAHDNDDPDLKPPSGYNTTYKRQVWDAPAGTVGTTYGMISGCRNVHPIATRALTSREALRLQSFPDSFRLSGTEGTIRTVVGNAVPPLLSFEIATFIKNYYIL